MFVTLCGSLKFEREFKEWSKLLTLAGHVPYSVSVYPSDQNGEKGWYTTEEKIQLDLAHLVKIEHSDAIVVLNRDGYIGDSTKREIVWARMRGKKVFWLEAAGQQSLTFARGHDYSAADLIGVGRVV